MQTNEQKKKNTLLIGVSIVGGVFLGAGLAMLGFKQFMKTDKAFNLCVNNHFEGYDTIRAIAYSNGIAMAAFNDAGDYKPLADWNVGNNVEVLKEFGEKIVEMAKGE